MRKTRDARAHHDSRRWLKHRKPRRSDPMRWLPPPDVWEQDVARAVAGYQQAVRILSRQAEERAYRSGRASPGAGAVLAGANAKLTARVDAVEWALRYLARADPEARALAVAELRGTCPAATVKTGLFYRAVAYGLGYRGGGPDAP